MVEIVVVTEEEVVWWEIEHHQSVVLDDIKLFPCSLLRFCSYYIDDKIESLLMLCCSVLLD